MQYYQITDEPKENNEIVEVVDTHTPFQVAPYKNQIQEFVYVIGCMYFFFHFFCFVILSFSLFRVSLTDIY